MDLLVITGSLRAASLNRALARAAANLAASDVTVRHFPLESVPFYNGDLDGEGRYPDGVAELHRAIRTADAVLFVTPEYNHVVPGVLQNAVDWASRPHGRSPLRGKPVGVIGASPGRMGTARAQDHLKFVLFTIGARVMAEPSVMLGQAGEAFDEDGRLVHEPVRRLVRNYMAALADHAVASVADKNARVAA